MHACDLAILKSGGLTVTECLCAELPMILLGKSYGQEKSNTAMLTSFGATLHATTSRELIMQLRHLHDNSEALHGLLVNANALRRPDAAKDIVRKTMRLVGVPRELIMQLRHLHDNSEALHGLLVNANALRRPDAAKDIVRKTMRLVGVPCERERHFAEFYWGGRPAHIR